MISDLHKMLKMIDRSAKVLRYHAHPTVHKQSVGEHTYGVMWLVLLLTDHQASRALLVAALMHDAPEYVTGDAPAPVKRTYGVGAGYKALENLALMELSLTEPKLSPDEAWILKLADNLEGALFCAGELRRGNLEIEECLVNYITYLRAQEPHPVAVEIVNKIVKESSHVITF